MDLLKIVLGNRKAEFSVIGIANVANGTVKFQGLLNGIPFCQSSDYDRVRSKVVRAVEINQQHEEMN